MWGLKQQCVLSKAAVPKVMRLLKEHKRCAPAFSKHSNSLFDICGH